MTTQTRCFAIVAIAAASTAACAASGTGDDGSRFAGPADAGGHPVTDAPADVALLDTSMSDVVTPPPDAPDEADADFCTGSGPIVVVGDTVNQYSTCTGAIAAASFANALCTCHDATFAGYLRTRGFDSGLNPPDGGTSAPTAAPVGINNRYLSGGFTDIAGAFAITGYDPTIFAGYLKTADDLRSVSDLTFIGKSEIAGDGWLAGSMFSLGPVTFDGDLHHKSFAIATPLDVKGSNQQGLVTVAPPCNCDPAALLDVGKLIDDAKQSNDNWAIGLDPAAFSNILGSVDATLPCGRFFLNSINVPLGLLTLHVTGRVALFIDSDITTLGKLSVDLTPGAQIDIFVRGTLHLTGEAGFGDQAHPAATRIYVGGSQDITLVGYDHFVGNIYAPLAKLYMPGYIPLYGALFVKDYISGSYTELNYDSAITRAGDDCPPPPHCTQCNGCTGGQACVGGACGTCTTNDECCGLMKCVAGTCQNVIH